MTSFVDERIVVTGIGLASPNGNSLDEFRESLLSGRSGVVAYELAADDGELLIRGPHVMKGYYKDQKATDTVLRDGWLYTGDVGTIDSDGFVKITGRKKEIYVNSGGKNIAPLVIEESK